MNRSRLNRHLTARMIAAVALVAAPATQAQTIRILTVGDSITASSSTNYRLPMARAALARGCDLAFVGEYADSSTSVATRHSAISGIRADTVDNGYINTWMRNGLPDVVTIHLGTNDSWQGRPAAATLASLGSIIDKIRLVNPRATIFVAQIIPSTLPALNALAMQLNALIPGLAASKTTSTSPVTVVDQASGFFAAADTSDGVHPTMNGQNKMGARWFDALVAAGVCKAGPRLINLAEGRPVNTSVLSSSGTPHQAFDDDVRGTGWNQRSSLTVPQSMEIDLGALSSVRYLELTHSATGPTQTDTSTTRGYRIELSADRSVWTTVALVSNNQQGRTAHTIAPTRARHVRLTIENPNIYGLSSNTVAMREFRVMGLPE
jgi:lysophospholipase L1-like esterase